MPIMHDVRPCAHTPLPPRRLVAGYVGPASGLRTALLTGTAYATRTALIGGAR